MLKYYLKLPNDRLFCIYFITINIHLHISSVSVLTSAVEAAVGRPLYLGDFLSSPSRPDGVWGPPSLLSSGYGGLSPQR